MTVSADSAITPRQARARLRLWQQRLGLEHWNIRFRFSPKAPEGSDSASVNITRVDWDADYLEGVIFLDLHAIPLAALDSYILHELCVHPIWWPISQLANDWATTKRMRNTLRRAEEQSTVMLERVLCRCYGVTPWNELAERPAV